MNSWDEKRLMELMMKGTWTEFIDKSALLAAGVEIKEHTHNKDSNDAYRFSRMFLPVENQRLCKNCTYHDESYCSRMRILVDGDFFCRDWAKREEEDEE